MNRLFIIIILLASFAADVPARQPGPGYRGFLEWSNNYRSDHVWNIGSREGFLYTGVSTSHGYQICPEVFIGGGLLVQHCSKLDETLLAAFVHGRTDLKFGRFTPFGEIRLGYFGNEGGGIYFSPAIGYRFNWGCKIGINIGAGMTLQGFKYYLYDINISPDGYWTGSYIGKERSSRLYFSFKIGLDF